MRERSQNEIAQAIIDIDSRTTPLVEEWFAVLTRVHSDTRRRRGDLIIEVGRERDSLVRELRELRNRHGLLRETLASVRAGDAGPAEARAALVTDAELAPDGEFYESQPATAGQEGDE